MKMGGSVASSSHGIPRTTLDVDIVADLKPEQVEPLAKELSAEFARRSWREIRPDGDEVIECAVAPPVVTPEDTILRKLQSYRAGGEISERQWNDILGVWRTVGAQLDSEYLNRWAAGLGVADLLRRLP